MKQPEMAPPVVGHDSALPRFLRGLFRSQRPTPPAPAPGPDASATARAVEAIEQAALEPVPVFFSQHGAPRVLVVDDDEVFLKAMDLKLTRAGCRVFTAQDGPEAINAARTANPDVIILDIGLPSDVSVAWDGIRVMQWIKRLENGSAPPIIIVTASGSPAVKQSALDFGAAAFFQKPFDHAEFWEAIKAAVMRRDLDPHRKSEAQS